MRLPDCFRRDQQFLIQPVLVSMVCAACPMSWAAESPWDGPPFSATPTALVRALANDPAPESADIEVLKREATYEIDEKGRVTERRHVVYRCLTRSAVEYWATVRADWTAWHEERPTIRARVITAEGTEHWLDGETITEVPVSSSYASVFTDRKMLESPLPAVGVGSVVEHEVVRREHRPFFEKGIVRTEQFAALVPTRSIRLHIQAPVATPLAYRVRGIDLQPEVSEAEGMRKWSFEGGPFEPLERFESFLPPEMPRLSHVVFSTGESWSEIAKAYAEMVEKQLRNPAGGEALPPITVEPRTREQAVARVLELIHRQIRYTGLAFGEAAIVPYPPRQTLARRYGDCKDQSALFVALLRAIGYPAHVALLRAGTPEEIVPELPGLSAFDHAIVYVPGDPPMWVDPTAEWVPSGQLPLADQGRLALVASSTTKDLVRTPRAPSQANRTVTNRDVYIAETGKIRLVTKTRSFGSIAAERRYTYGTRPKKELHDAFEKFARERYNAESVGRFEYSDPRDFSVPFTTESEMLGATCGALDHLGATVVLSTGSVLQRLPYALASPVSGSPGAGNASADEARRDAPLFLMEPYVDEMHFRVVPPRGYVPRELPKNQTLQFGPARLDVQYSTDGNAILADVVFDSGPGPFSPDEVLAARRAITELDAGAGAEAWNLLVSFEHAGARLLAEGRTRDGVAEYHRLLKEGPEAAFRHSQLAIALLEAGLGSGARYHARRAVELSPDSALVHRGLAWVLSHDTVGRYLSPGFARNEAVAAYRRTLELDEADAQSRWNLAILLEHDVHGNRYATDDLDEAIRLYRQVREETGNDELNTNLMVALLFAEEYVEIKELADKIPESPLRSPIIVAAVAADEGMEAARKKAAALTRSPNDLGNLLTEVFNYLGSMRRYSQAIQLVEGSVLGPSQQAVVRQAAKGLARIEPLEKVRFDPDDPRRPVQDLFVNLLVTGQRSEQTMGLYSNWPNPEQELRQPVPTPRFIQDLARVVRDTGGMPPRRRADLASLPEMTSEGDDASGYRVTVTFDNQLVAVYYVVKTDQGYRLWYVGPRHSELGSRAREHLQSGEVQAARSWLTWAWEGTKTQVGWFNHFSAIPFAQLWAIGKRENEEDLRLAAATLVATGPHADKALKTLLDARPVADPYVALQIDRALAQAYLELDRPQDAVPVCQRIAEKHPRAEEPRLLQVVALSQLRQYGAVRELAQQWLKTFPDNAAALTWLASAASEEGDLETVTTCSRKLQEAETESASVCNTVAWFGVCQDPVLEKAVDDARKANELSGYQNWMYLHTLATACAELGRVNEARGALIQTVNARGYGPTSADQYVIGRMAEQCGLHDIAMTAYRQVRKTRFHLGPSPYDLAQRRIKGLQSP